MKIFAYYLPQFHCIPENDAWWGKGFTEWTNVKKMKPLFEGHVQPKHPLNNNYYNLTNIETLKWQSKLIEDYYLDGLIFYHYYFNGKKLLEKPAELLLKDKNIKMPFFFCWANHDWCRSWEGSKKILIKQEYGNQLDWEQHFNYLLPFFKDNRYEKRNNKPVFMIFKSDFYEKKDMFDFFDFKCKENGFDGICLIETIENYTDVNKKNGCNQTEFYHLREPGTTLNIFRKKLSYLPIRFVDKIKMKFNNKFIKIYNGKLLFKIMIKKDYMEKNIIRGAFLEWDNTPRHQNRGYIITPTTKELFSTYILKHKRDEYIFINAWNEWCEGMILEPTEENGYKYLEWIKEIKKKEINN